MDRNSKKISEEISIRELIETVWKGKVIIAIVTVIAVLFSFVISFFVLSEQYEAETVLMVTINEIATTNMEDISGIINNLTKMPIMTMETYIEQTKSPIVLENTIKKLELKDAAGNHISASSLSGTIIVTNIQGTNLLSIKVNNQDPEMAMKIANTMSQFFIELMTKNSKDNSQKVADLLEKQLSIEEQNIKEKTQALAEYWSKNGDIDLLKSELEMLVCQIGEYEEDLRNTDTQISSDMAALKILESASKTQDNAQIEDYDFNVDISDDAEIIEADQIQLIIPSDNLSGSLLTINISKTQARLISNLTRKEALINKIQEMETTLTESQILLTEEEYKYNAINQDIELAQQAYDAYQQRYKKIVITAAADTGNTIVVSSEAIAPDQPISPNKMMNIVVAALLGLCLGLFIVFFKHYWKKSMVK